MFDLDRFKDAQGRAVGGVKAASIELEAGRKRGHWIWYVFPQLAGLGHSSMAVHYGLTGIPEAIAYLRDPVLRGRLLALTDIVVMQLQGQPARSLTDLMGSEIDARKLVSSMTLFRNLARRLGARDPLPDYAAFAAKAEALLGAAAAQGLPECAFTLEQLAHHDESDR